MENSSNEAAVESSAPVPEEAEAPETDAEESAAEESAEAAPVEPNAAPADESPAAEAESSEETLAAEATSGDYEYEVNEDGKTVTITGYNGGKNAEIPSVLDGYSVTSIGDQAFECCTILTSVSIPDSVTSIGDRAFFVCISLTSVSIPDSVTSIGYDAFASCSKLTSITIPDSVTSIGSGAFSDCSKLTSVSIPDSVTFIGGSAFHGCSKLTSITIPDSVTSIDSGTFSDCSKLTSVTLPDSVTSIGGRAFEDCTSLASVSIPDSVTSIGYWAFRGCKSLTSVSIPDSVTSIGDLAFGSCSSLTEITVAAGNSVYCSRDGVLFNKDQTTLVLYPAGKSDSYTIPDSVTSIGTYAFYDCTSLTSVSIPDSVTSISSGAFEDCYSLTNVIFEGDQSKISIDETAFSGTPWWQQESGEEDNNESAYTYVVNSDGKTATITGYTGTKRFISIPSSLDGYSVTSIGDFASWNRYSLISVSIPDSVTSIGNYAFFNCQKLFSVNIPDSVTSIGGSAFDGCSRLTSVTLPDSVTSIGGRAFYNCSSLTSVTLPSISSFFAMNSINSIFEETPWLKAHTGQESSFYYTTWNGEAIITGCYDWSAKNIVIPERLDGCPVTCIAKYAFDGEDTECILSHLVSISIPDTVTSIGDFAFWGCHLTSISIPSSVTSIGDQAFECCSLTSITIPESVTSIGDSAFASNKLTSITLLSKNVKLGKYALGYDVDLDSLTASSEALSAASEETLSTTASKYTKVKGFYLVGRTGSTAQTYAKKNGFTFKAFGDPTLSAVSNAAKGLTVSWKKVDGATGYRVYRKEGSAKSWSKVADISKNSTVSWTDTKAKSYKTYTYTVRACTKNGKKTVWSGYNKSGKTNLRIPALTLSGVSNVKGRKLKVSWKQNTSVNGYEVQYSTDKSFKKGVTKKTVSKNKTTSATCSKLKKGKTYYVRVRSYKKVGKSNYYSGWSTKSVKIKK